MDSVPSTISVEELGMFPFRSQSTVKALPIVIVSPVVGTLFVSQLSADVQLLSPAAPSSKLI